MSYQCFLLEPLLGKVIDIDNRREWPPNNYIIRWRRVDTGEEKETVHQFGIGAMWQAIWYPKNMTWDNETDPHLIVCCPNGDDGVRDWDIDSRAKNCGLPSERLHRCWVRHGVAPLLTVDKNGVTCDAGAGSIALPKWHGFLTNGVLDTSR